MSGDSSTIQLIKGEMDPKDLDKADVAVLEVETGSPPPMTGAIYKPCSVDLHDGNRNLGGSPVAAPNGVIAGDEKITAAPETPKSGNNSEVRPSSSWSFRVFSSFLTRFKCCGGKTATEDDTGEGEENNAPALDLQDIFEPHREVVQPEPGTVASATETEEVAVEQLA